MVAQSMGCGSSACPAHPCASSTRCSVCAAKFIELLLYLFTLWQLGNVSFLFGAWKACLSKWKWALSSQRCGSELCWLFMKSGFISLMDSSGCDGSRGAHRVRREELQRLNTQRSWKRVNQHKHRFLSLLCLPGMWPCLMLRGPRASRGGCVGRASRCCRDLVPLLAESRLSWGWGSVSAGGAFWGGRRGLQHSLVKSSATFPQISLGCVLDFH